MKIENVRLQRLMEMLKNSPEDSFLLFAAAQEYTKLQDYDSARDFYAELLTKHPDYTGAYLHSGKLYELQENIQAAIAEYEKGVDVCQRLNATHDLNELNTALNIID